MKKRTRFFLIIAVAWMAFGQAATIYKCTQKDGKVIFTDKECVNMPQVVVHTETPAEIQRRLYVDQVAALKQLISNGQTAEAKAFAEQNNLLGVFEQESQNAKLAQAQKAQAEKQAAEQARQQQILLQKQQLELQNQQLAAEKAKLEQQASQQHSSGVYPVYHNYSYSSRPVTGISQPHVGLPNTSIVVPAPVNSQPIATTPMNPPNNPVTSTSQTKPR